jgi:hypothetical protein
MKMQGTRYKVQDTSNNKQVRRSKVQEMNNAFRIQTMFKTLNKNL